MLILFGELSARTRAGTVLLKMDKIGPVPLNTLGTELDLDRGSPSASRGASAESQQHVSPQPTTIGSGVAEGRVSGW